MTNNRQLVKQIEQELLKRQIQKELIKRQAQNSILPFTKYTFPMYQVTWFHQVYGNIINLFAENKIKRLIVSMPPQFGKSQISTRHLPAYLLGKNNKLRIAIASYNATKAREFSRDIQRIIADPLYNEVFPNTNIRGSEHARILNINNQDLTKTMEKFEVMNIDGIKTGDVRAVGRGGALTGNPVDIMIMDDLYKDYAEGNSPLIRQNVIDWYTSVVRTRFHNNSQELIVFTRWHEDDLIGYIEKNYEVELLTKYEQLENPNSQIWYKINFPALQTADNITEWDNREIGESLWPEMHGKEKLEDFKQLDIEKFESLYQGDPQPRQGLLFQEPLNTYTILPPLKYRYNYTDTADTGKDYLCSIDFGVGVDDKIYILDIIYTQEAQEETEIQVAKMLDRDNINTAFIESNNGGRAFARNVDRLSGYRHCIEWFHQGQNKESRIISNASNIKRLVYFPLNWEGRWQLFHKHVTRFKKNFKANEFDDCIDTLVGICEYSGLIGNSMLLWK